MSRRHAGGYKIPDNPTWIDFPRSDGSSNNWPKNTSMVVDSEGQVNYMRPVELDESLAIMWRTSVGAAIASKMGMPEGPGYVLRDFPEGYHLYDHNKGPAKTPRHDPYLVGSVSVNRFRSTNEFIPHALWLMQDETMNRGNCQCKYCTKQPQRIISDTMGLSGKRSASAVGNLSRGSSRGPRNRRERRELRDRVPLSKPYAAIRRAPKPPEVLTGPQQYIPPECDQDVRAALGVGEEPPLRRYRKGEVIWCNVDPAIIANDAKEGILFWPGIVEEFRIKVEHFHVDIPDADVDMTPLYEEAEDANMGALPGDDASGAETGKSTLAPLEVPGRVPWRVFQQYVYKIRLLGTTSDVYLTDQHVVPYLAYAPSNQILHQVEQELERYFQTVSIEEMDRILENSSFSFNPMMPDDPSMQGQSTRFYDATAPYTLAIQIASQLARYWLPTDEWDCKYLIPPPEPRPSTSSQQQPAKENQQPQRAPLHSVIQSSLAHNAMTSPMGSGPNGSTAEPESISMAGRVSRTAAAAAAVASSTVTQTRFHGLWWGTERIWTGEFVRLKIARCQFAPNGAHNVLRPSGPSASTTEYFSTTSPELVSQIALEIMGAADRGLFLRLEGLVIVDTPGPAGFVKECRATGMVYELADVDWEEQTEPTDVSRIDEKGKGKARELPTDVAPATQEEGISTCMSQPSPLKPGPLPNPDPTIPVPETASPILPQTSPAVSASANAISDAESRVRSLNAQLSHPVLSTSYPSPKAPVGYKFRPILPPDHEVVVSLALISGRYYPSLLSHPLLAEKVQKAQRNQEEMSQIRHLLALDGLVPGAHQSMDPRFWRGSRIIMLQEADTRAREQFRERWEEAKMVRLHPQDTAENYDKAPMEVD